MRVGLVSRPAAVVAIVGLLIAGLGFASLRVMQIEQLERRATGEAEVALASVVRQVDRDVAGMVTVGAGPVDPRGLDEESWGRPLDLIQDEGGLQAVFGVNLAQPLSPGGATGRLPSSIRDHLELDLSDGPDHVVITHVWPVETNERARGYDILQNEQAAQAAPLALEESRVVATSPTTLVQDEGVRAMIVYVPILGARGEAVALATVTFQTQELFDQVLISDEGLRMRWRDVATGEVLAETEPPPGDEVTASATAEVVGRSWALDVDASIQSLGASSRLAPWTAVALGLALTGFAAFSVRQARREREFALQLVSERTGELEDSTRRLEESNRQLERAARAKDDLLAAVSHDLRSPLTVIRGFATTLQRHDLPPDDVVQGLRRIERQANRLNALIEDLLTAAQLEEGDSVTPQQALIDLSVLARELVGDLGIGQVVGDDTEVNVVADPVHVERIIANLLSNASKHGAPPLTVSLGADEQGGWLAVSDRGDGVPDDHLTEMFEPFTQFAERRDGVGLGLSIAVQLAEINGGSLVYDPPADGGARFVLRLPSADGVSAQMSLIG